MSGIHMFVGSAQAQADSIKTMTDKEVQGYEAVLQSLNQFLSAEDLQTDAYNNGKAFFSGVLIPTIQAGILVSEAVGSAAQKFVTEYQAKVDPGDLKSEELEEKIQKLDTQIQHLEHLTTTMNKSDASESIKSTALLHQKMQMNCLTNAKKVLQETLEKLKQFHAESPAIFSEIAALEAAAKQGASQAKAGFNGQKFIMPADLAWTSLVTDKWSKYERDKNGYDEKMVEQLKKYNVCVFFYEDYEGNIKPSWKIEDKETGLCIQNKKLFKYLYKAGQYLDPSMIEVITYDEYQNRIALAWRRGASYDTGDQYGGLMGATIAGSQYLGQTLKWFNETELGNALQTLGFAYGAYRLTTPAGTKTIQGGSKQPNAAAVPKAQAPTGKTWSKSVNKGSIPKNLPPIVQAPKPVNPLKLPENFLNEALGQQGLTSVPQKLKQKWTHGGYNYEVRVHAGNNKFTTAKTIYRVARKQIPIHGQQGSGMEYMDINGKWWQEKVLKEVFRDGTLNPLFNHNAAVNTHHPIKP
ncbi:hypothetical protein [uncultured Enterococcus sp.]|uniref:hypothetical protein n=1 Tax=uncultured Enterococcus sp. TaxID=167972 RepID=UPI002AA75A7A|nr:hypothetical protein [uncultured Enterococcus sp.]